MSDKTPRDGQNVTENQRPRPELEREAESRVAALQARFDDWSQQLRKEPCDAQIAHFELRDVLLLRITHATDLLRCCSLLDDEAWNVEWQHVERAVYRAEQALNQVPPVGVPTKSTTASET